MKLSYDRAFVEVYMVDQQDVITTSSPIETPLDPLF